MTGRERVEQTLQAHHVQYELFTHPMSFTAQHTAEVEHVSGRRVMKVVVVEAAGKPIMVVVPATHHVDPDKVAAVIGVKHARVADEGEFARLFPDCEIGAMPPFGNLYGLPVYIDASFVEVDKVVFPAASHAESIALAYRDYARLARPVVADLVAVPHPAAQ